MISYENNFRTDHTGADHIRIHLPATIMGSSRQGEGEATGKPAIVTRLQT